MEIARLDGEHRWRRGTVWADLDQAPLAFALEHLALLAELTAHAARNWGRWGDRVGLRGTRMEGR